MTDHRAHRGAGPADRELFGADRVQALRAATGDLAWLLTRGYQETSALKLVGDRYALRARQRVAVGRCACGESARQRRLAHRRPIGCLAERALVIDGFNCLITLETALSGGILLVGRDGCTRDLGGVHGSYRPVEETGRALELVGERLAGLEAVDVTWVLDRPVSNSGRLRSRLLELAEARGWPWRVRLEGSPDRLLAEGTEVVATADSWILDRCAAWVDLVGDLVARHCPGAWRLEV